ncbi:MAG: hypothetical protein K6G58_07755 [Lachnospiraceae bacterium]|nr:hypothetical protein [Lachnospiraceae bacterium]
MMTRTVISALITALLLTGCGVSVSLPEKAEDAAGTKNEPTEIIWWVYSAA